MSSKSRRMTAAVALFLTLTVTQVYVGVGFAAPSSGSSGIPSTGPQQILGILTTRGNQPISVNGASTISGATILSGATIETPDQVGGTINLGTLGTLDIAPNTKLSIAFDQNGNVKVKLISGCVILRTKKGTSGEVEVPTGSAGKTDKKADGVIDVCFPVGAAAPTVGTGAAAAAGAGAGVPAAVAGGLGTAAIVAIVGGGVGVTTLVVIGTRGTNPSPSTP